MATISLDGPSNVPIWVHSYMMSDLCLDAKGREERDLVSGTAGDKIFHLKAAVKINTQTQISHPVL